ncbi:hypothetical protein ACUN0C_18955 [Faunimonas sp. B44]|uniref:hypothetical protein n=1 Tax=Faunimonas sp. B44 TaxID=3461493 RepID=UPI0040441A1D
MLVDVYWNSRRRCYSVRHKGRVIHHLTALSIERPRFVVSQKGRERVIATGEKNVHAVIRGRLWCMFGIPAGQKSRAREVRYNPFVNSSFVDQDNKPVTRADLAILQVDAARKPRIYAKDDRPQ